jgi:N-methylhydantoinase A/oxoprolinase/acetone carboxylase beta subunit
LIPRELRLEVPERMGSKGEVVTPLDTPALEKLAGEIKNSAPSRWRFFS